MSTQPIDYSALAKQYGATQSTAPAVDYDALAKQHGAISSAAPEQASGDTGVFNAAKRVVKSIASFPGDVAIEYGRPAENPTESAIASAPMGQALLAGKRLLIDPLQNEAQKARNLEEIAKRTGNQDAQHLSNMHAIASGVPVVGPLAANITERYLLGDKSGAATELAGYIAAPKVTEKLLNANVKLPKGSTEALKPRVLSGPQAAVMPEMANLPAKAIDGLEKQFKASAPTGMNRNYRANLAVAAPDLAEIGRTIKLDEAKGGIINPDMRVRATVDATNTYLQKMYQEERAPQIQRNASTPIAQNFGTDAEEGLKYMARTGGESDIRAIAQKAVDGSTLTVAEADKLAIAVNSNLKGFESMTPADRAAASMINRRLGSVKALDRALSEGLNTTLKNAGEPGLSSYERRYAALSEYRDQLSKRMNAVELDQPGVVKGVLKPVASIFMGGKSGIASASQAAVADVNIGRMLQKGFEDLASTDLKPNRSIRPTPQWPANYQNSPRQLGRGGAGGGRGGANYSADELAAFKAKHKI